MTNKQLGKYIGKEVQIQLYETSKNLEGYLFHLNFNRVDAYFIASYSSHDDSGHYFDASYFFFAADVARLSTAPNK